MEAIKFKLIIKGMKAEFPNNQQEFSKRLQELRKQKIAVAPFVAVYNERYNNNTQWMKYQEYKKLKREEVKVC